MLHIFFGSQTGNAQNLALTLGDALAGAAIENRVESMGDAAPELLTELSHVIIVTSTFGDGEAPDNASEWLSYVKFSDEAKLNQLKFAVLGLGDPYYPHFCQCGKDFDFFLQQRGAAPLVERLDCDRYYEDQYGEWLNKLISVLKIELN
jgi:sulfite reductase (NADPH) flavoprotein alpha-component